jgi:phthalate 4,5-dioxygenase
MPLSHKENDRLCRVENGAPMGEFLRNSYWFPACLSMQLVEDDPPLRVKLLGKPFVAFRSTDGRVGFFPEGCPHRGTSLALARNEDNALRCIYHGWKFRVDGVTVEVPTQPEHHDEFCKTVPLKAYPVREAGRMVWVWLGDGPPAKFPDFEFNAVPDDQVYAVLQQVRYNWVQGVEGQVDSAHISILHQDWVRKTDDNNIASAVKDTAPRYEFEDIGAGFRYAAIRNIGGGEQYIRVTAFAAPWYCFIPFAEGTCEIHVPLDDVTTALYIVRWNPDGRPKADHLNPTEDPANFPPYLKGDASQRWGQDREAMKNGSFAGFPFHVIAEDFAVGESQGPLADRTVEFLNTADRAVMRFRRVLLDALSDYEAGKRPAVADHETINYPSIRGEGMTVPLSTDWRTYNGRAVLTAS